MLRLALCLLALGSPLFAGGIVAPQPVAITGVVELVPPLPSPPPVLCVLPEYQLACSGGQVFLQSSTVDLGAIVGQNRRLIATQVSPQCPLWEVTEVTDPVSTLALCGTPKGGCDLRFRSGPGGISQHLVWFSLAPGFVPLGTLKGAFQLGEPFVLLASVAGAFPPEGAAFDVSLPPDPILWGQTLYVQSASRQVGPIVGPLRLANSVCFSVIPAPSGVLCIQPDC